MASNSSTVAKGGRPKSSDPTNSGNDDDNDDNNNKEQPAIVSTAAAANTTSSSSSNKSNTTNKEITFKINTTSDDDKDSSSSHHRRGDLSSPRSSHRAHISTENRSTPLIWMFVLPTAAVMTTDVWFPDISLGGIDIQLVVLNVTGALMEGFFAAWESSDLTPSGPITGMLAYLADDMRGFFISTYTSWVGMISFAAMISHQQLEAGRHSSVYVGFLYILISVVLGYIAFAVGNAIAHLVSLLSSSLAATKKKTNGANSNTEKQQQQQMEFKFDDSDNSTHILLSNVFLVILIIYIIVSYILVLTNIKDFHSAFFAHEDDEYDYWKGLKSSMVVLLEIDNDNRILIDIVFSIGGAFTGNVVGNMIDSFYENHHMYKHIPRGTLFCNIIFTLLSLSLNILSIRQKNVWEHSILLQSFATCYCGAASAFAGHASDTVDTYYGNNENDNSNNGDSKDDDGSNDNDDGSGNSNSSSLSSWRLYAFENFATNLFFASMVYLIAYEIEYLLKNIREIDINSNGIVELHEIASYYGYNFTKDHDEL